MSISFETLALAKRYTNSAVADAIGRVTSIDFRFVESLPWAGDPGVIYCIPSGGSEPDLYDEYYYVNGRFERIPGATIDLTPYATKDWINGEGYYKKPAAGIPKTDLDDDTKAAIEKAETALQEHQSLAAYRTAQEQDAIDNTLANIKEIEVGDTEPTDQNVSLWMYQNPGQKIEIPTMEDFRNLKPATEEQVSAAVSDWLEENISGGETIAVDKSLTVEGAAADAKAVGDLKSAISKAESALTSKTLVELETNDEYEIPADTPTQDIDLSVEGETIALKQITNNAKACTLPYVVTGSWIIFNATGESTRSPVLDVFANITGKPFVWIHITDLVTNATFYTETAVCDENGNAVTSPISSTGWYAIYTSSGEVSLNFGYSNPRGFTFDKFVAVDSDYLTEHFPEVTWNAAALSKFVEYFPASIYGSLDFGETSPASKTVDGSVTITHNGTDTTYTEDATVTVYAEDNVAVSAGSASFELVRPRALVGSVNDILPDENGNVELPMVKKVNGVEADENGDIDTHEVDGRLYSAYAKALEKRKELRFLGEADDELIASLSSPSVNDAYFYHTTKVHGLYKDIVCDGDILYCDGSEWCTLKTNPSTFDNYENERVYDVVIVGGGAGGIGAAYALKDSGYKVCVVEALDSLGGTHVNGGVIQMLSSPAPSFLKAILEDMETNLPDMVSESSQRSYGDSSESAFDKHWRGGLITPSSGRGTTYSINPWAFSERYYKDLTDAGIDVLCGVEFQSLEQDNGVVRNITVKHRHSGLVEKIWGFYFVDSTSFGSLCTYDKTLGTDYYRGTDNRARFNESAIPQDYTADPTRVNTSEADYMFEDTTRNYNAPLCKNTNAFAASQGRWEVPNGIGKTIKVMSTEGSDRSSAYIFTDYPRSVNESKNRTKDHFKKFFGEISAHRYIQPMPLIAMRETNRIKCGAAFTENNLTTTATTQNYRANHYVALASWHIDLHDDTGVDTEALPTPSRLCGLPYEALIPDAYNNVLVGSKCFGSSHIGLSYFRLTKTCMSIGYAAGKAVKLAITDGFLDDLRDVDIEDLQDEIGIGSLLSDIEAYYDLSNY